MNKLHHQNDILPQCSEKHRLILFHNFIDLHQHTSGKHLDTITLVVSARGIVKNELGPALSLQYLSGLFVRQATFVLVDLQNGKKPK